MFYTNNKIIAVNRAQCRANETNQTYYVHLDSNGYCVTSDYMSESKTIYTANPMGEKFVIILPDGYNNDFVICKSTPLELHGNVYTLSVYNSTYLIKNVSIYDWNFAIHAMNLQCNYNDSAMFNP